MTLICLARPCQYVRLGAPSDILAALEHFWVPSKVRDIMRLYYSKFKMRITTWQYTTAWWPLIMGLPMGYAILPPLVVPTMEMIAFLTLLE